MNGEFTYNDNINNMSIVTYFTAPGVSVMSTGDAEKEVEEYVLSTGEVLKSDVMKAGHHGSSTSNTVEFVTAVNPKIFIISCGEDNKYGHPHKEVRDLIDEMQMDAYRTDTMGSIIVSVESDGLKVTTQK